jgi:curli biogenesis system outer membrane secretion channel CsgG
VLLFLLLCTIAFVQDGLAAGKPRIGVLRFTNHSAAAWWNGGVGTDLQDMLISELASTGSFRVLERRELDAVLDELSRTLAGRRQARGPRSRWRRPRPGRPARRDAARSATTTSTLFIPGAWSRAPRSGVVMRTSPRAFI